MTQFIKILLLMMITSFMTKTDAQVDLTTKQNAIIRIAALTGKGNLEKLNNELNVGLDAGLTINEINSTLTN